MTHLPGQKIKERFPNIFKKCMELGIDITIDPIPVVPAAHYQCGGIMTDLDARTTIPGLFAAGEVACTGVHGANRLASNSLLEAVVFSDRAAKALSSSSSGSQISVPVPGKDFPEYTFIDEVDPVVRQLQKEIKEIMWQYVGIVRTRKHIKYAIKRLKLIREEILELFRDRKINAELVQSRNMACAASLVAKSANRRLESRGLHYLAEHPEPDDGNPKKNTLIVWNREEKIIQS
jgi:L-aspartate oxidase